RRLRPRRGRDARDAGAGRDPRAGQRVRLDGGRRALPESGAAPALSRAGMGMRNFLERLVARTVEATAVRPRVASRYEQGPWGDRASGQPAAVETAHVDAPAAPSRPVARPEARPARDPERRHAVRDRTPA